MEIHHLQTAEGHEVSGFLIDGYHELMHQGFAPRTSAVPINWDHKVIYATVAGEIVGALTWSRVEWKNTVYINLGYVHPLFRRQGIYSSLWDELIKKAIELEAACIEGSSAIGNTSIEEVNKVLGRRPVSITYRYDLKTGHHGQS